MVESGNNPFESFLISILVVKNVFSPIQSNFHKISKNIEHCFSTVHQLGHSTIVSCNDRKKWKVEDKIFVGKFKEKSHRNIPNKVFQRLSFNVWKKEVKEDNGGVDGREGDQNVNLLSFEVALSMMINSIVHAFPRPFSVISDNHDIMKVKEGKNMPFECDIGFVFNQLNHVLKLGDCKSENVPTYQPYQFRPNNMNRCLRNQKFARFGGVPLSIIEVHVREMEDEKKSDDASKATTIPTQNPSSADSVLKSALAGGLSCAFSTALMHPVDTIKTQVQASTLTFPEILSKIPEFGVRGLYLGSIPAIFGQFFSHGLRTGLCEVSKLVLVKVAPTMPKNQVESMASFCGTFLGTTMRIPCEVLKQRLQAGQFENVGKAIVGTWKQDGLNGFFRGTGATLCREIPFYVAGTGIYTESKKALEKLLGRELEAWEAIVVGAISGGVTAVSTTPLDVIKTRMMTATQGQPVTLSMVVVTVLRNEGPIGLFKGAIPRFFWVAPLGAINFAGYELARKAMDRNSCTR